MRHRRKPFPAVFLFFFPFILIVIVLMGLSFALGFVVRPYSATGEPSHDPLAILHIRPQPTDDGYNDVSHWKTYTNTVNGYSVRYPPDWVRDTSASEIPITTDTTDTAILRIAKDGTVWELDINPSAYHTDSFIRNPFICGDDVYTEENESEKKCIMRKDKTPLSVMGVSLSKELYTQYGSTYTYYVRLIDPKSGIPSVVIDGTQYYVSYSGDSLNENIKTLDTISRTLTLLPND